jgi:hypothetical protein
MSTPRPPDDRETAEELRRVEVEPLLPAEKWLIAGSLLLGVILLGVLWWVSTRFFPANPS